MCNATLLVQDRTLVGSRNCDIQLSGLGIQPEHCVIELHEGALVLTPVSNARCFVNGAPITQPCPVYHGDRILWGNHHFFRVNCPKSTATSEPQTPAQTLDYNFAREELMMKDLSNDPIQAAIARLEKQHEEDKQGTILYQFFIKFPLILSGSYAVSFTLRA